MKLFVFAVLDKAVGAYASPFFMRSKAEGTRAFSEAVSDGKSPFSKHPDDYVLYHLCGFDDASGMFSSMEPERVLSARECIVQPDGSVN